MKKIVAFVPAKGNSSRVPKKNLKEIGGLPLVIRACYNLNQVLDKESIVVDSDDDEILNIAIKHGFKTLKRPSELATNATDGNAFFRWETSNYPDADIYIQHLPPMPFLSKSTLQNCINAITKEDYDSIVCVGKEHYYLWDDKEGKPLYDLANIPNSFNLEYTTFETMGLYVITKKAHKKNGLRIGDNYKMIDVPKIEQVDINYPDEYDFAYAIEAGLVDDSIYKSKNLKIKDTIAKLKDIKLIVSDVDGVLTDGKMIYSENGDELKNFNTRDGIAAKNLKMAGYKLMLLSSGICNNLISKRGNFLGFDKVEITTENKANVLEKTLKEMNLKFENVLYLGDDTNDLDVMKLCKVKCCPADAWKTVKNTSDIVLSTNGGDGCLREVSELLLMEEV